MQTITLPAVYHRTGPLLLIIQRLALSIPTLPAYLWVNIPVLPLLLFLKILDNYCRKQVQHNNRHHQSEAEVVRNRQPISTIHTLHAIWRPNQTTLHNCHPLVIRRHPKQGEKGSEKVREVGMFGEARTEPNCAEQGDSQIGVNEKEKKKDSANIPKRGKRDDEGV